MVCVAVLSLCDLAVALAMSPSQSTTIGVTLTDIRIEDTLSTSSVHKGLLGRRFSVAAGASPWIPPVGVWPTHSIPCPLSPCCLQPPPYA